jgi:two-component system, LytTR family, sensor kinase
MKNPFFSDNRLKITLHVVLWIIVFILPIYISRAFGFTEIRQLWHFYNVAIAYGMIFYISYLYLVPNFYFKNKKWRFFIIVVSLLAVLYFVIVFISDHLLADPERDRHFDEVMRKLNDGHEYKRPPMEMFRLINYTFTSVMIVGFAMGLGFMERHRDDEKKRKELEKEKLHSELAFLKNQISPHFFFNTLNNIYSLTTIDTPAAQESILKLSKLMRYLLYESEHGETLVSHEIDFMTNYIALMKLRLSPRVDLKVSFPTEFSDCSIPPLLFIPFIENAFKHGISNREASFIDIQMTVQNSNIKFQTINSLGKSNQPSDSEHSGIGLENVKKRLALLFPEKHHLDISKTEQLFKVELEINIKPMEL